MSDELLRDKNALISALNALLDHPQLYIDYRTLGADKMTALAAVMHDAKVRLHPTEAREP